MNGSHSKVHQTLRYVLRQMHCRNTHHRFAIDALPLVQTAAGKRLACLIVRHHKRYLTGATDPDTRICDYHNQIIHVDDGCWGGAPRVAHQWYHRLQTRLITEKYADAAQAAGILCHYFTDILQPLHTGSTAREALVHLPIERSIYACYDEIMKRWIDDEQRVVFRLSGHPNWLASAMLHSARYAHQKYSLLVNSYRFDEGVKDPQTGLDEHSRAALAELFGLAITGWARVIERAAQDAEAVMRKPLPKASSLWPTSTAIARAPFRRWRGRVEQCLLKKKALAIAEEYRRTGRLVKHLPHEVDIKQRVIQVRKDEANYKIIRQYWLDKNRQAQDSADTPTDAIPITRPTAMNNPTMSLSIRDSIYKAPSIGPKTAERFEEIGIRTLSQFLSCDHIETAERLGAYWIEPELVRTWKRQASLMCNLPGLSELDAQMLVGAGFETPKQVTDADDELIRAEVQRFALTAAGRRYLSRVELKANVHRYVA